MPEFAAGKPASHRPQKACANCRFAFKRSDYEGGESLFCTFNAPPRPPCGSVSLGESFFTVADPTVASASEVDALYEAALDAWAAWSCYRGVDPQDVCDEIKPTDEVLRYLGAKI